MRAVDPDLFPEDNDVPCDEPPPAALATDDVSSDESISSASDDENTPPIVQHRNSSSTAQPRTRRRKGRRKFTKKKGSMQGTNTYVKKKRVSARKRRRKAKPKAPIVEEAIDSEHLAISQERIRSIISEYYHVILEAPPPEDWDGEGGTVYQIIEGLKMDKNKDRHKVRRVILKTHKALLQGDEYVAMREYRPGTTAIKQGSIQQKLIADYREKGLSFTETTMMINRYCYENGLETVTRSAVVTMEGLMKPKYIPIKKRPQGSDDVNSTWAKCRYRFVTQLLIRMGYHNASYLDEDEIKEGAVDLDALTREFPDENGGLPDFFNPVELPPLDLDAIGWWDEMHKKCFIGQYREGQKVNVQFPRNEEGGFDINGTYSGDDVAASNLQVKYEKEGRLCLGVAVREVDGRREGVRLLPWDYSACKIITIKETDKLIATEIARVKALDRNTKEWTSDPEASARVYWNDLLVSVFSQIKQLSKAKAVLLASKGIKTIRDLHDLCSKPQSELKEFLKSVKGIALKGLQAMRDSCLTPEEGNRPRVEYYIDARNPYEARFGREPDEWGEEKWKSEILKSSTFSGKKCITELVKHIVLETKKCYAGNKHDATYYFYHDALSQLTNALTVEWMKTTKIPGEDKFIYDRWIKPELGLADMYGPSWVRPVGNSAEMMPMDNHLNNDGHESVRTQVVVSMSIMPAVVSG
eukprot:scaffold36269_cov40-Cyclotella_meneghiniana.AAC.2